MNLRLAPLVVVALSAALATAQPPPETPIGRPLALRGVVIPGPRAVAAEATAKSVLLVKILDVAPHGTAWRYDLEVEGYEAGEHNVLAFLRREDGTAIEGAPPLRVRVTSALPPGQVLPHAPGVADTPDVGGYFHFLVAAGLLWVAGLAVILFWKRPPRAKATVAAARPVTVAERLRPLVQAALAGTLPSRERAALELGIVAFWRERVQGLDPDPARAIAALRRHPEAGPLLLALEDWLHRPDPPAEVDLGALLAPYAAAPAPESKGHG